LEVLYVPGHSRTDICLWDPQTGEALVGDHLLRDISANAFIEPPDRTESERPKPLLDYRKSLQRTRELPWTTVYPGHGEPFTGHAALIDQRFAEHEERCHRILEELRAGARTVYQVSRALFPWLKDNAVFLGLSEVQGHLDLLEARGQVVVSWQGHVRCYQPVNR
jgi:glyoxylase-like metal-dependent hydrolase (beta-lactamase superfamily II)